MSFDIVIRITVPDGTMIQTGEGLPPTHAGSAEYMKGVGPAAFVPPFEDELIPLPPEAIPIAGDPPAFRAPAARAAETAPRLCPTHHEPWKLVPEGVSKKTRRPYSAFYACPVRGCDQRPAA